jgi:hypothetical protein
MTLQADSKLLASQRWFGYGRWEAPYWFVGMEPGGTPDRTSYDSWFRLGATELIDCKAHHLDWNALAGREISRWHRPTKPPTQRTWLPLIQLLLAYLGQPAGLENARYYQRDMWGMSHGETALIELSVLRATNLDVEVDRERHRDYRINLIRTRMLEQQPRFVVFYGVSYREFYERIAGGLFDSAGFRWSGRTLCVLVAHPRARRRPLATQSWIDLGKRTSSIVNAGPQVTLPTELSDCMKSVALAHDASEPSASLGATDVQLVPIRQNSKPVGRISFDGRNLRVERRDPAKGKFETIGFYEKVIRSTTFCRKVKEINCVFAKWAAISAPNVADIKVFWREKENVPNFLPAEGVLKSGCSVVLLNGDEIARIYKLPGDRAVWVESRER